MSLATGSVAVVLGTRPEAVKLSVLVELLGEAAVVIHSGQHYDDTLAANVHRSVGLLPPDVMLDVGGAPRARQISSALSAIDDVLEELEPAALVVQGDTNTSLAGALAANSRAIPLFHVEAGLRSFDRAMPEEHNRVVTDHLADWCGAPTEVSRQNLLVEGIPTDRIEVTGNTIVEAVTRLLPSPDERARLPAAHDVAGGFALATFHRPENVDDRDVLATILGELGRLGVLVLLPMHPRTRARVEAFGLGGMLDALRVTDPLPPDVFLGLAAEAQLWITDSGGMQEEASLLKRPVIVVRRSTERPEVEGTFSVRVDPGPGISDQAGVWLADLPAVLDRLAATPTPYGDGTASARTLAAIDRIAGDA